MVKGTQFTGVISRSLGPNQVSILTVYNHQTPESGIHSQAGRVGRPRRLAIGVHGGYRGGEFEGDNFLDEVLSLFPRVEDLTIVPYSNNL